jgi:predicted nucleic acid-binding protein
MKKYLLDTDILIRWYRGEAIGKAVYEALSPAQRTFSVITYLEFSVGEAIQKRTAKDNRTIDAIFAGGEIIDFTPRDAAQAARWALQHNLGKKHMNDLAIAATAKRLNRELLTTNTQDFDFLSGVRLVQGVRP